MIEIDNTGARFTASLALYAVSKVDFPLNLRVIMHPTQVMNISGESVIFVDGFKEGNCPVSWPDAETTFVGRALIQDATLPRDVIEFRVGNELVGRIKNLWFRADD